MVCAVAGSLVAGSLVAGSLDIVVSLLHAMVCTVAHFLPSPTPMIISPTPYHFAFQAILSGLRTSLHPIILRIILPTTCHFAH
jgi:hypothetical protein